MMQPGSGIMLAGLTGLTASPAEINVLDGVTPGTAAAGKALVLDASKTVSTIASTTITLLTTNVIIGPATGVLTISLPGQLMEITGLPTEDPSVEGYLWNDNGTLKISTG